MPAEITRLESPSLWLRMRLPAVLSALLFLACEFLARPFAAMGVADDWSYIQSARVLAQTGHIVYNGWATAMIGWQFYPAALLIRLFGFSFSAPRVTVLLIAACTVFLTQRVMVRAGISERNATLGTFALTLHPLFMELSASFMTDIPGLFTLVLCLYLCLRALQAATSNAATAWIVVAALSNAVLGSCRQIAWLGVLVLVPCTLWLLRRNRQILLAGLASTFVGVVCVFASMRWFAHQPYSISEGILPAIHGLHTVFYMGRQLFRALLELPFLLLAIAVAFLPELRRRTAKFNVFVVLGCLAYGFANYQLVRHHAAGTLIQPLLGDWLSTKAHYDGTGLIGDGPIVLGPTLLTLLSFLALLSLFGVIAFLVRLREPRTEPIPQPPNQLSSNQLSWYSLAVLLVPFALAYFTLLIPRAASNLIDRYLLELEFVAAILLLRAYQQFIRPRLPALTVLAIAIIGLFGIGSVHDMFSLYRARVQLASELAATGIPDTALDGGFEHNGYTEFERSAYINDPRINPRTAFHPGDPYLGNESCTGKAIAHGEYPHYAPHLGVSFTPTACGGATPYAPVTYARWLGAPATLYLVKYQSITAPK